MVDIRLYITLRQFILYKTVDFQVVPYTRRLHFASSVCLCLSEKDACIYRCIETAASIRSHSLTQHGLMHDLFLGVKAEPPYTFTGEN